MLSRCWKGTRDHDRATELRIDGVGMDFGLPASYGVRIPLDGIAKNPIVPGDQGLVEMRDRWWARLPSRPVSDLLRRWDNFPCGTG
jgi:hypothetical protein